MFLTDCHTCGLRELRGARSIELFANTEAGPTLVYRCTRCDAVNLLTGDRTPATPATEPVVPAAAPVTGDLVAA